MNGVGVLGIVSGVIAVDIIANHYYIKRIGEPNHKILWLLRFIIGALVTYDSDRLFWLEKLVTLVPLWWFVFDYGLNKARGKYLIYLGVKKEEKFLDLLKQNPFRSSYSIIDQIQLKLLPEFVWFIFKGILCIFSIVHMLYNYNPYSNPF